MRLQAKLTLTLLLVSLVTALTVGAVAYGLLMADFRHSVKEKAFQNFEADITDYLQRYSSLHEGAKQEPFDHFVHKRRAPELQPDEMPLRPGLPPFYFMILDPQGRIMKKGENIEQGQRASDRILKRARPIVIDGQLVVQIVPIGEPVLTKRDQKYLDIMRRALIAGLVAAGVIAIILGLVLGRGLSGSLRKLLAAIRSMRLDESIPQTVEVRSRDEVGLLAESFNKMSARLSRTHADLQESHDRVKAQAEELHNLSIRDPLTALFNRRHFDAKADGLFHQAVRYGKPFTVMIGDLDHFKQINDTISHAVGDQVLQTVAQLLQDNTRKSDIVARYGGEEFVIAFGENSLEQAGQMCEKIRRLVEEHPWDTIDARLHVTISMGLCDDLSLGSVQRMLSVADKRLYEAKSSGRNRMVPPPKAA